MLISTLKTKPANIITVIFVCGHLSIIIFAKTYGIKKAKKEFAQYRKLWNETFKDNSFDQYFKLNEIFDMFFEDIFKTTMSERILRDMLHNKTYKKDWYNRRTQKYEYPNTIERALKYFGYSTTSEIKEDVLKRKYKEMLKKVHPDNGGSTAATEELIKNYNILKETI